MLSFEYEYGHVFSLPDDSFGLSVFCYVSEDAKPASIA